MAGLLCETMARLGGGGCSCVYIRVSVCVRAHSRLIVPLGMDACLCQRVFTLKNAAPWSRGGRKNRRRCWPTRASGTAASPPEAGSQPPWVDRAVIDREQPDGRSLQTESWVPLAGIPPRQRRPNTISHFSPLAQLELMVFWLVVNK